jgi:hypothetical protein
VPNCTIINIGTYENKFLINSCNIDTKIDIIVDIKGGTKFSNRDGKNILR